MHLLCIVMTVIRSPTIHTLYMYPQNINVTLALGPFCVS